MSNNWPGRVRARPIAQIVPFFWDGREGRGHSMLLAAAFAGRLRQRDKYGPGRDVGILLAGPIRVQSSRPTIYNGLSYVGRYEITIMFECSILTPSIG
jgi:hypothetical protein